MRVRGILFDLDDTLIPDHEDNDAARLATAQRVSRRWDAVDATELAGSIKEQAERLWLRTHGPLVRHIGTSSTEGLWSTGTTGHDSLMPLLQWLPEFRKEAWSQALAVCGLDDDEAAAFAAERFITERRQLVAPYADVYPLLQRLQGRVRLGMLTNGMPGLQEKKINLAALRGFFDVIIVSGYLGVGKPSDEIFAHALEQLGTAAGETLMVGNSLVSDIRGADAAGLQTLWLDRTAAFEGARRSWRRAASLQDFDRHLAGD